MARPSKPMAKNSNSKFTPRNNKQDIFTKLAKTSKQKAESDNNTMNVSKPDTDNPNP